MKNLSIVVVILILVLGCRFGNSDAYRCQALLKYKDETLKGSGETEQIAKENACIDFCRKHDPVYEARYRIWLETPAGQRKKGISKEKAIYEDDGLFRYVSETCNRPCVAKFESENRFETKCR